MVAKIGFIWLRASLSRGALNFVFQLVDRGSLLAVKTLK
jgi:hypothetical protein